MTVQMIKKRRLASGESDVEDRFNGYGIYSSRQTDPGRQSVTVSKILTFKKPSTEADAPPRIQHPVTQDSGVLQLKVDALLAEASLKHDRVLEIKRALHLVKGIIENIPEQAPLSVSDATKAQDSLHRIGVPFTNPNPVKDLQYRLAYAKPSRIEVVGSYAREIAINFNDPLTVDLAVEMPSSLFEIKDYLNYRYFHKKAYYLSCITTGLRKHKAGRFDLQYCYRNDNMLQPVLQVMPHSDDADKSASKIPFQIRILVSANDSIFPLNKVLPGRDCIKRDRSGWNEKTSRQAAHIYNATLRSECLIFRYEDFLNSISAQTKSFQATCRLGNIWLLQRSFGSSISNGGFGSFEWSCVTALLCSNNKQNAVPLISQGFTPYQMFKAVLHFLCTTNLLLYPLLIPQNHPGAQPDFRLYDGPVLFDSVRGVNILYKMSIWSYNTLRQSAIRCLTFLSDPLVDHFESCFITKASMQAHTRDVVIRVPVQNALVERRDGFNATIQLQRFSNHVYEILRRGLGDRVTLIDLKPHATKAWDVETLATSHLEDDWISIGLIIDGDKVNRTVEKGPPAEDQPAAAAFRRFWGEKAELRRFKDGSIVESIIWESSNANRPILSQIIRHLLRSHVSEKVAERAEIIGERLDLELSHSSNLDLAQAQPSYKEFYALFEEFERHLRSLEGLPLRIRQISAADPQLCSMSVYSPIQGNASASRQYADVFIQFEASGRWPDEFEAIQRSKFGFLLKIGELLEITNPDIVTKVGLENDRLPLHNVSFLDVLYPTGAAFRLRVHIAREAALIEKELAETAKSTLEREAAASALAAYKRKFVQTPLHTQAMRSMSTRFSAFPQCVRVMKRWRDCHLLSNHISDELIELLTLRTFLHPGPHAVPGTATTAFFRTVLFISKWDWRSQPLVVDMSSELGVSDIESIYMHFEAWRRIDPAMNKVVLFAASNLDRDGITWTASGPSTVAATRFTSLARAAAVMVNDQGHRLQVDALFLPILQDYDFVTYLKAKPPEDDSRTSSAFKNLQTRDNGEASVVDLETRRSFLADLQRLYVNMVIFFYDKDKCDVVGGLWNPTTSMRTWKTNLGFSSAPRQGNDGQRGMVGLNENGTLHDIARLGKGMIHAIKLKNQR